MATIRSFVALPSPVELKNVLLGIQGELKEEHADVKWDSPDKFHVTLKFFGNVETERISELSDALSLATSGAESFSLVYSSLGAFPDLVHPGVVWVGADTNAALTFLQHQLDGACDCFGFPKETRTFHPHITLGRLKGNTNVGRLTAKLKSITFEPLITHCSEVLLVKSDLHPTGSIYTTLKSFPLKA